MNRNTGQWQKIWSDATPEVFKKYIEALQPHAAIEEILQFVRAINRIFTAAEPWKLVKNDLDAAGSILSRTIEGIRIAAIMLNPVMPNKTIENA